MTTVASVSQIVAVIRRQLGTTDRARRIDGAGLSRKSGAAATRPDLQSLVRQRVAAIDPADPERGRKAFRVFLESVLLSEIDASLISDPQFYRLVDDVQRQMESDPELATAIEAAVAHLASATRD